MIVRTKQCEYQLYNHGINYINMSADRKGENRKIMDEIETPEPPQRMYPLEYPFEEQTVPNKKHGLSKDEKVKTKE